MAKESEEMSEKIQTEFARNIIEGVKEEPKRDQKNRPKLCRALKSCFYLASVSEDEQNSYLCCGIYHRRKDEDIICLCMRNVHGEREKFWITPWEAGALNLILGHASLFSLLKGNPEADEIAVNMYEKGRTKRKKEANR